MNELTIAFMLFYPKTEREREKKELFDMFSSVAYHLSCLPLLFESNSKLI